MNKIIKLNFDKNYQNLTSNPYLRSKYFMGEIRKESVQE